MVGLRTLFESSSVGVLACVFMFIPAAAEDQPSWPLVVEIGKEYEGDLHGVAGFGPFVTELEKDSDRTLMERFVAKWPKPCDICEVVELGAWYKWRPYLLIVDESCTDYGNNYFVALKEGQHYRVLMFVENSPRQFSRPIFKIAHHDGGDILVFDQLENASGLYHIDHYFVFDAEKEVPALLDMAAIGEAFQELVPPGYSIKRSNSFDIDTLTYHHAVWKPDDHYRWPTGGNIYLRFRLEEGRLVLEEGRYEPNPEEQLGY